MGVLLRTYVTHSVTIVWLVNLVGIFLCFSPCFLRIRKEVFIGIIIYLVISSVTVLTNTEYFTNSIKGIGTNANIIIVPITLLIIDYASQTNSFSDKEIIKLLQIISALGCIAVLVAWVQGSSSFVRIIRRSLSIYRADIDGFFYGKNIYGAFVSLTAIADLYLYTIFGKRIQRFIVLLKVLAVVLSFSRAALLQCGIMMFVYWWAQKKHRKRDYLYLILLFSVIISSILINENLQDFILRNIIRTDVGDAGRVYLKRRALTRFGGGLIPVLFGVGYAGIDFLRIDIDNTYYYLLFSGGVFKCLFYLFILIHNRYRIKTMRIRNRALGNLSLSILISYLFFAEFESVAILELGLLNFIFTLYIFIIPNGYVGMVRNKDHALN